MTLEESRFYNVVKSYNLDILKDYEKCCRDKLNITKKKNYYWWLGFIEAAGLYLDMNISQLTTLKELLLDIYYVKKKRLFSNKYAWVLR